MSSDTGGEVSEQEMSKAHSCLGVANNSEEVFLGSEHPPEDATLFPSDRVVSARKISLIGHPSTPLMYFKINLDSCSVQKGLLDSGAQKSLIHESILPSVSVHFVDISRKHMLTAIGESVGILSMGTVDLDISVQGVKFGKMTFVVVPKRYPMTCRLILGMDFLTKSCLEIDVKNRTVTRMLPDSSQYMWQVGVDGQQGGVMLRRVTCVAASPVKLRDQERIKVPIAFSNPEVAALMHHVGDNSVLLYEEAPPKKHPKLKTVPGIVDPARMSVYVTCVGNQPVNVSKGHALGVISSVVELDPDDTDLVPWTAERLSTEVPLTELPEEQRHKVWSLLNNCQSVFSTGDKDVGTASVTAHKIVLYDDTPVYQRPRRFPEPITEEIERQCRELCELDIIEPSSSPWSSPVVPIRKKDGSIRLCVDYRRLNQQTKPDRSPIPSLSESVYGLYGTKYFTSLDLVRGYYQVPLEETSRECTAFSTSRSQYQFKRLSFGLRNAPAAFQREIQAVLREFPWRKVVVYIDDILILGDSFEEHLNLVQRVLTTLARHGIKIKPAKCQWFSSSVDFLGHTISRTGIKKQQAFIEKVDAFPRPETVTQMREFLGLINFQRKFIQDSSVLQKPLSEVTGGKKKDKITWTDKMQEAFEKLKQLMREDMELAFPCYNDDAQKMELYVDASMTGAGACLRQCQDGEDKIIAYASMAFNASQRNYSTIDRELAALRWGVKTFRSFLYGVEFIIKTDHQPLVYLHSMRLVDSRLARTLTDLADFNFTIMYTPGKTNVAADALSRMRFPEHPEEQQGLPQQLPPGLALDGDVVPGGGDSLFISLHRVIASQAIGDPSLTPLKLRELLVDEVLRSPIKYGFTKLTGGRSRDIRLMRYPGQLPCLEVLLAASFIFRLRILVYFWSDEPIIYQDCRPGEENLTTVHLQCLGGIHFNALQETEGYISSQSRHLTCMSVSSGEETHKVRGVQEGPVPEVEKELPSKCHRCAPSLHPRVLLALAGESFCGILDTGSEISLVRQSVLDRVKRKLSVSLSRDEHIAVEGFSGAYADIGKTVDLKVELGADMKSFTHTFAVVRDDLIPNCMLLGIDFMMVHGLSISGTAKVCSQNIECVPRKLKLLCIGASASVREAESRDTGHEDAQDISHITLTPLLEWQSILAKQLADPLLQELRNVVKANLDKSNWPSSLKAYRMAKVEFAVWDNLLFCQWQQQRPVVVVPHVILVEIAISLHNSMAHLGRDKLLHLLRQHLWHPGLYAVTNDICVTCPQCQLMKWSRQVQLPPTVKIATSRPFEMVAVDLVQFPRTSSGNIGCCVLVDHNSKWTSVVPIKSKMSASVVNIIERQMLPFLPRIPTKILSDNGPEFKSQTFTEFVNRYSITHICTTPYKPSSNGCVERVNRTIGEFLRNLSANGNWDDNLVKAVLVYNNTKHRELGVSPSEYLLGRQHEFADLPLLTDAQSAFWKLGHPNFLPFEVNQKVIKKVPFKGHEAAAKFQPKYEGPFTIIQTNDNGLTYVLQQDRSNVQVRAHHPQLIPWNAPPKYLKDHPRYRDLAVACMDEPLQESDTSSEFLGFGLNLTVSEDSLSETASSAFCGYPFSQASDNSLCMTDISLDLIAAGPHEIMPEVGEPSESECSSDPFCNSPQRNNNSQYYQLCELELTEADTSLFVLSDTAAQMSIPDQFVAVKANFPGHDGSGVVLSREDETWDPSSISFNVEDLPGCPAAQVADGSSFRTIAGDAINQILRQTTEALSAVLSGSSSPESFAGFSAGDTSSPSGSRGLIQRLRGVILGERRHLLGGGVSSSSDASPGVPVEIPPSRATRSTGPAEDLPYIQQFPIEYNYRSAQTLRAADVVPASHTASDMAESIENYDSQTILN